MLGSGNGTIEGMAAGFRADVDGVENNLKVKESSLACVVVSLIAHLGEVKKYFQYPITQPPPKTACSRIALLLCVVVSLIAPLGEGKLAEPFHIASWL